MKKISLLFISLIFSLFALGQTEKNILPIIINELHYLNNFQSLLTIFSLLETVLLMEENGVNYFKILTSRTEVSVEIQLGEYTIVSQSY